MGSRGPKPKDAATLKLRGSWRAKTRAHGPTPVSELADGKPRKPQGLSGEAGEFWDKWVPRLTEMGVARKIDEPMLQAMCEMWGLYRATFKIVASKPDDKDARIALTSYKTAFDNVAARFGMSPRDRERLTVETPNGEQPQGKLRYFTGPDSVARRNRSS